MRYEGEYGESRVDGTYPENQGPDFSVDRAATDLELAYVRKTAESVTGRHDDLEYGDDPFFGADEMLMVIARLDAAEAEVAGYMRVQEELADKVYAAEAECERLRAQAALDDKRITKWIDKYHATEVEYARVWTECERLRAVVEAARKDTTGCWNPWPGTGPDGGPVDHDCGVCPGCVLSDALAKLDNLEGTE